ncbi:hypothetical protein SDC9_177668 [bioreactor metagenome]|uniref:Uncharacterized protein n=1 Tax=bioreactor metagenome TaxID=1076179 RepID=A0A645GTW4_9ZZZZ
MVDPGGNQVIRSIQSRLGFAAAHGVFQQINAGTDRPFSQRELGRIGMILVKDVFEAHARLEFRPAETDFFQYSLRLRFEFCERRCR